MYVGYTGKAENKDVYIIQSYRKENGKTSSRLIAKLGKYNDLLERFGGDEAKMKAWAEERAREETEKYKKSLRRFR